MQPLISGGWWYIFSEKENFFFFFLKLPPSQTYHCVCPSTSYLHVAYKFKSNSYLLIWGHFFNRKYDSDKNSTFKR